MQEIKKRRIVLASVLKPVDDSRMFEKIGRSLAEIHEVHVIGFGNDEFGATSNVHQHAIGTFPRLSLARIVTPWKVLRRIFQIRPDVLIICTHELLLQGLIAKIVTGCRLWYDVQENYARNIRHTHSFPAILRPLVAAFVRLRERIVTPAIERFLLAEKSYSDEMVFMRKKGIVIQNKLRRTGTATTRIPISQKQRGFINLLFSGTLSESTGVFEAISIASSLYDLDSNIRLTLAGYCARSTEYEKLKRLCNEKPFITLKGGGSLLPHHEILREISVADAGIISYPINPSTWSSIPTKLFEYLGNRLPIILIANPEWVSIAARFDAAVVFDPQRFPAAEVLEILRQKNFYTTDPQDVYWESEETRLLGLI
jgi:glycosyltransferase involved in cell wall biosynthesis